MESLLFVEVAKQLPSLCALGVIVKYFVGVITKQMELQRKHDEARDAALAQTLNHIGDDCHDVQREANQVMGDVRIALGEVREALRERAG